MAARAAQLADDTTKARSYWSQLIDLTASGDESRPELKEAKVAAADLRLR